MMAKLNTQLNLDAQWPLMKLFENFQQLNSGSSAY
jgi:hypothetical protein